MAEKKTKATKNTKDEIQTSADDVAVIEVAEDSSTIAQNDTTEQEKPVLDTETVEEVEKKPAKKSTKKAVATPEKASNKAKNENKLKNSEKRHARKYREVEVLVDREKEYTPAEAMDLLVKTSTTKFDSSAEVHIRLNVDPKNAEHQIRGSLVLPHGTGKNKVVLAIVGSEKEKEATEAGADFVGAEDMIAKIEKGWLEFDIVVATPDMMPKLGKIGKILGVKGLMPNPKVGTVTPNVGGVIKDIKKGMIEYKVDKNGIMHLVFGKVSFGTTKLIENYDTLLETVIKVRPSGVKGTYIKSVSVATTMGPGIKVLQK